MTTSFTSAEARGAVRLLSSRALIRLITEIDDNGVTPPRGLARTFPDLSRHQLRQTTEAAHAHGLIRITLGGGLELTESGRELADVYDATARWARRHAYPTPICDFTRRIRHAFGLLTASLATEEADSVGRPNAIRRLSASAATDLAHPRARLLQWLTANPHVTAVPEPEPAA